MHHRQAIAITQPNPGFWRALPLAVAISTGLWGMGFAIAAALAHHS